MLSEKGVSRPHSSLKVLVEEETKRYPRARSPQLNVPKDYKVRSYSPKNVNVNVNVNINENVLPSPTSFHIPHKEPFRNSPQYYAPPFPNNNQLEAKVKQPHFLERVKSKPSNP